MSCAHTIRRILLHVGQPLTAHDILVRIAPPVDAQQVHSILATELGARRIARTGQRGSYAYTLTETGMSAAHDPRWLRSRFNRRTRYN